MKRYGLAAMLVTLSLALAGCGPFGGGTASKSSASTSPTSSSATSGPPVKATAATKVMAAGAAKVTAAGSAKVDGTFVTQAVGVGPKLTVHFAGAERWSPSLAGNLTLTGVHVGDATVGTVTMRVTSQAIYLKLPMLSTVLHKQWAKISFKNSASFGGVDLGQFAGQAQQLQPAQYLHLLATSSTVKLVGKATIDGVSTRHYAGTVDLAKAIASVPNVPEIWTKLVTAGGIKSVKVNAWVDAANRPRKLTFALASSTLSMTVNLHLSSYGLKVTVIPPPAGQTLDLTHGLLGLG